MPTKQPIGNPMIRLLLATVMISLAAHGWAQSSVNASVAAHRDSIIATADALWNFAELGYLETESSATLQGVLETAGFSITRGVADIPTAFIASYGSGSPVIAILGEFDACPTHLPSKGRPVARPVAITCSARALWAPPSR
jgi:aminobenzoyl-glutamate utilization protein B